MLIDDYVPVHRSVLAANASLLTSGPELALAAATTTLSPSAVSLGPPRMRLDSLVIPFEWSTSGLMPFRQIDGDLVTAQLDPVTTHLRLSASCQLTVAPPRSRSQESDAQRATEHHVRAFLAALADALEVHADD